MHFSRPSAYRLSWCRPWYLGLVGVFSNGYCSVTVGLNIDEMVTPKPATGASAWPMPFFAGLSGWYPGSGSAGAPTSRVGRRVMSLSATWLLPPAGVGWCQWAGRSLDGRGLDGHDTRPLACIRHHPPGRQIPSTTADSRQAYGGSDPAGGARYILTGLTLR